MVVVSAEVALDVDLAHATQHEVARVHVKVSHAQLVQVEQRLGGYSDVYTALEQRFSDLLKQTTTEVASQLDHVQNRMLASMESCRQDARALVLESQEKAFAHATKEVKALLESINAARGTPPSADTLVVRLIFVALIEARHVEENVSDIVHK